jgi:hypothetical protein
MVAVVRTRGGAISLVQEEAAHPRRRLLCSHIAACTRSFEAEVTMKVLIQPLLLSVRGASVAVERTITPTSQLFQSWP